MFTIPMLARIMYMENVHHNLVIIIPINSGTCGEPC